MKIISGRHFDQRAEALFKGILDDPFAFLGPHKEADGYIVRFFQPHATAVWLQTLQGNVALPRVHVNGLFELRSAEIPPHPYLLIANEDVRFF